MTEAAGSDKAAGVKAAGATTAKATTAGADKAATKSTADRSAGKAATGAADDRNTTATTASKSRTDQAATADRAAPSTKDTQGGTAATGNQDARATAGSTDAKGGQDARGTKDAQATKDVRNGTDANTAKVAAATAADPAAADPMMVTASAAPAASASAAPGMAGVLNAPDPTDVSATAGDATISVTWTGVTGNGTVTYSVWASETADADHPGDAACDATTETTCEISGVTNGTEYHVYVMATDDDGASAAVEADTTATPAAEPLTAPTGVTAEPGNEKISVSWTAATGGTGELHYYAWATESEGGDYDGAAATCPDTDPITDTSCVITGLTNGTDYHVYVASHDDTDLSEAVAPDGDPVVTPFMPDAPGMPTGVSVLPGTMKLVVSWQAPADIGSGLTGYRVEVAEVNTSDVGSGCSTESLTCTVSELVVGTEYDLAVYAVGLDSVESEAAVAAGPFRVTPTVTDVPTPDTAPTAAGPLTSSGSSVSAGDVITISGSGFAADTLIEIVLYSAPQMVGTAQTDATGAFSKQVTLPAGLNGAHTLVAGGLGPDGNTRYLTTALAFPAAVSPVSAVTDSTSSASTSGLAITGAPVQQTALLGGVVLTFGLALVLVSRRRRTQ